MQCSIKIEIVSENDLNMSGTASKMDESPINIPFYIERSPFAPFPSQITIGTKYIKRLWDPSYWTLSVEKLSDDKPVERSCPH